MVQCLITMHISIHSNSSLGVYFRAEFKISYRKELKRIVFFLRMKSLGLAVVFFDINMTINEHDDNFTNETKETSFPLPAIATMVQQAATPHTEEENTTNLDQFMLQYPHLDYAEIDKANVPHDIVDDVVELLRECMQNNVKVQPELLR